MPPVLPKAHLHGWLVVIFGFLGFLVWSALYPIEQGIPGTGFLITKSEKVEVYSPSPGLVIKVNKQAGDSVSEGDLLVQFDTVTLQSNGRGIDQLINGVQVATYSMQSALSARQDQVAALRSQYESLLKLVEKGFSSPNALASIRAQLSLAESEALELQANIQQNESRLKELVEQKASILHEVTLKTVRSPIAGRVMNVSVKTSGVSIGAGSHILDIAPEGGQLLIDARVAADHANRLEMGMKVDVIFPTLPGSSMLRLTGSLEYLSADRITDPQTGQAYFEARVSLDELASVTRMGLRPGLPATVLFRGGPQTLLSYITRPFSERLARGLQ